MPARSSSARALAIRLSCPLVRRRFPRSRIRSMARWLALIGITQQISCAGGGGGGTPINNNVDLTPSVSITLSPASAQLAAGASVQFLVTVLNAPNPLVTWQVNGIPGGNPSIGTIMPSGAATASYAAPASVSSPLMDHRRCGFTIESNDGQLGHGYDQSAAPSRNNDFSSQSDTYDRSVAAIHRQRSKRAPARDLGS